MDSDPSLKMAPDRLEGLRLLILLLMSLIISVLLFPDILDRPRAYKPGDISQEDIKATRDLLIENDALTEKNRVEAAEAVPSVYDFDPDASDLVLRLKQAMSEAREIYYPASSGDKADALPADRESADEREERRALAQYQFFQTLEISPDQQLFNDLVKSKFAAEIEENASDLLSQVLARGIAGNTMVLMSQQQKGITLINLQTGDQSLVTDVSRFYSIEGAKNYIRSMKEDIREKTRSSAYAGISVNLAISLIRTNVTSNSRETLVRKELARQAVKPSFYQIKTGEMLIREGERIESEHLVKLAAENRLIEGKDTLKRVPGMAALIAIFFAAIYISGLMRFKSRVNEPGQLLFVVITLTVIFLLTWAYDFIAEEIARGFHSIVYRSLMFAMPVACGSMLIAIFQGMGMALVFSVAVSILSSLVIQSGGEEFFIYFFTGSLLAAYWVKDYRQRGILIRTGAKVGLVNILLCLALEINYGTLVSIDTIVAVAAGFIGGILAGVISTGIIPLVEMSFGFTTDIKLLELANLDQPLLRELMVQAPGTYHHSVIVSSMAEASAEAINANPLLAKVAAYYHDIGKMKKPHYFIENQMGGENRHDRLAPSMSALIILAHVRDGVELAREHGLNREIIDIIEQHQGTKLISFFYEKAKEQAEGKGAIATVLKEEDYRYPGPKPQTKEAGLVMLADMVEAATRALPDPNPSRVHGTVQRIINKVFSDGQLDDCEITLKDLHQIAKSFYITLSGIFHYRVEYPDSGPKSGKKQENGNTDKIQKEDAGPKHPDDKEDNEPGLKRLGM